MLFPFSLSICSTDALISRIDGCLRHHGLSIYLSSARSHACSLLSCLSAMTFLSFSFTASAPCLHHRISRGNAEFQKREKTADKWVVTFWMRSTLHLLFKLMDGESSNCLYGGSSLRFSATLTAPLLFLSLYSLMTAVRNLRSASRRSLCSCSRVKQHSIVSY